MNSESDLESSEVAERAIKQKVLDRLNEVIGDDVKNIGLCRNLYQKLLKEKAELEEKLLETRKEIPVKLENMVNDVNETCDQLSSLTLKYSELKNDVEEKLLGEELFYKQLEEYKSNMDDLKRGITYLTTLKYIEEISAEIEESLGDHEKCVQSYKQLCIMLSKFTDSACLNLVSFLKSVIFYWHSSLKTRLTNEFEDLLKLIKWPFISLGNVAVEPPPLDLKSSFQKLVKLLYTIQLPEEVRADHMPAEITPLMASFPPLSLPVELLISPLQKRFLYHFCTKKPTNRPDKPEWMFLQLLNWIKDHEKFVDEWVQPVSEDVFGELSASSKMEFISGFVRMAVDKLSKELPLLLDNDSLFSHTTDEVLHFHKTLIHNYDYATSFPSVLSVLSQAQIFMKWTDMEKKFAKERMDDMLSSPNAWKTLFEDTKCKVTECGDLFVTLLYAMNERYSSLPQPGHRLQFLDVQLELIDEFRVRLLQLLHEERDDPLNSKLPQILNTVHYLINALTEWGTSTHFMVLHHYKKQIDPNSSSKNSMSVFDDMIYLLVRMVDDLKDALCETVMMEIKARSRPYRQDRWNAMPSWNSVLLPTLTASGCAMFQILMNSLHCLQSVLAPEIFSSCLEIISAQFSEMMIEDVILQNKFNEGGAQQLHFDVRRNLLPLVAQYKSKPEVYFLQLLEACSLLCMDKSVDAESIPMAVHYLSIEKAKMILDRRVNWLSKLTID